MLETLLATLLIVCPPKPKAVISNVSAPAVGQHAVAGAAHPRTTRVEVIRVAKPTPQRPTPAPVVLRERKPSALPWVALAGAVAAGIVLASQDRSHDVTVIAPAPSGPEGPVWPPGHHKH